MLGADDVLRLGHEFIAMYDEIEIKILTKIAAEFRGSGGGVFGGKLTAGNIGAWQMEKLQDFGRLNRVNTKMLSEYIYGVSEDELLKVLNRAGREVLDYDEKIYRRAYRDGAMGDIPVPVPADASWEVKQVIKNALANMKTNLNLINTTALQSANEAFLRIVNRTYLEVAAGVNDYQTAMQGAVNELAAKGIAGVQYVRQSGVVVNMGVDTAIRRMLITTVVQAGAQMQLARAQEWGTNLVEVSSHIGARPEHALWQGKIYSINGSRPEYPNLVESTGYGTVTGLCGANCRHFMFPFIEGYSEQAHKPYDLERNQAEYEESQEQRAMERDIRKLKKRAAVYDSAGMQTEAMRAWKKIDRKEAALQEWAKTRNRLARKNRLLVHGVDY